jgi:HEAT repeat protein
MFLLVGVAVNAVGDAAEKVPQSLSGARKPHSVIDSAMEKDPELIVPEPETVFSPQLKPLWLKALARPEADLQRQAADAIARAHRLGMKGLSDAVPELLKIVDAPDSHRLARLSAARALVALDAKQAVASLSQHLPTQGIAYAQIVEPALARWDYRPVRTIWIDRLSERNVRRGELQLAIRGLAVVKETSAARRLTTLAGDSAVAPQIRLSAARASGQLRSMGLYERAKSLAADKSPRHLLDRLVAATMLSRHQGEPVQKLLLQLAVDSDPTVSAVALQRLLKIDPLLVLPKVDELLTRRDANVRRLAAEALAARADASSIKKLGPLFNDPHPGNRDFARETLRRFASTQQLDPLVRAEATRVLQLRDWRGQEQAALLLAQLDHKPAAKRLIALLESSRPEVMAATGWALRKLAIPETLPAMLDKATRETNNSQKVGTPGKGPMPGVGYPREGYDAQLFQLLQAFGQMRYAPAAPLLRRFIPKSVPFPVHVRAAAVWSLGFIDPGPRRAELTKQLSGRLADAFGMFPEFELVRRMSAVALGRLKAKDQIGTLRRFYSHDGPGSEVGLACRWAIHEITGETLPGPPHREVFPSGWFLEPLISPPAKSQ